MKKHPHFVMFVLVAVCVALGASLGARVQRLRDSDRFYRWIVTASTQLRLFDTITPELENEIVNEGEAAFMDQDLFDRIVAVAEQELEPIPLRDGDYDEDGEPFPLLVRYTRILGAGELSAEPDAGQADSAQEQTRRDAQVWALASGSKLARERNDFIQYIQQNLLASAGAQIGLPDIYRDREAPVSISQMFLGFRKTAASFLWIQVDEAFHEGAMQRLIPLMRTVVLLDPNFVDAYLVGAWHLAYNATAQLPDTPERLKVYDPEHGAWVGDKERFYYAGVRFLKDGIRNNPRDYRLYFDLGFAVYEEKLKDHARAVRYLKEATRQTHESWVRRMLYHCLRRNGQLEESRDGWRDYLKMDPGHPASLRYLAITEGLIKERDADHIAEEARDLAKKAKDARAAADDARARLASLPEGDAQAASLQASLADLEAAAEAAQDEFKSVADKRDALRAELRDYWARLHAGDEEGEPIAVTRLKRLQALELYDQGRYLEAVAHLRAARWQSSDFFEEASELIIDILQEIGEPLNMSERKWLLEREEADRRRAERPVQVAGRVFEYRMQAWHEQGFNDQETVLLTPGSALLEDLVKNQPEVDRFVGLGDHVVFTLDGQTWYEYRRNI